MEKSVQPVVAPEKKEDVPAIKSVEPPAQPAAAPPKEDTPHWLNRVLKVAAWPIAAISGLWVTRTSARARLYKTIRDTKEFRPIEKKFHDLHQANITQCDTGVIDTATFSAKALEIRTANRAAVDVQMEKLGINGFFNKWRHLSPSNRQVAVIEGMTIAGIAIGALLTIANSRSLIDFFSGQEEDREQSR